MNGHVIAGVKSIGKAGAQQRTMITQEMVQMYSWEAL